MRLKLVSRKPPWRYKRVYYRVMDIAGVFSIIAGRDRSNAPLIYNKAFTSCDENHRSV